MVLTKISQQKRNLNNVNLFLDNEFWCSVSKDQLVEYGLHKGIKISENQKKEIEEASGLNKIKEAIIKYVAYRPRSKKEIRDNLILKKNKDPELVDSVISKLETQNSELVNDLSFTRWFAENRMNFGFHGPQKIKMELMKKGIEGKIIESVLGELQSEEELSEVRVQKIKDFIEKKKRTTKAKDEYELKQKITQSLMRKGFRYDEVKAHLENL